MDEPNEIVFERGWPELIVDIVIDISYHTGPLMIVADSGNHPVIISSLTDRVSLLTTWNH